MIPKAGSLVYPNPTNGLLYIENENVSKIEIFSLLGEKVLQPAIQQHSIDISTLPVGMYFTNLYTEKGLIFAKIVKE